MPLARKVAPHRGGAQLTRQLGHVPVPAEHRIDLNVDAGGAQSRPHRADLRRPHSLIRQIDRDGG